jgi:hypothetical protein
VKQTATQIHEVHMVISSKTDGLSLSSLSGGGHMASVCETDGHFDS